MRLLLAYTIKALLRVSAMQRSKFVATLFRIVTTLFQHLNEDMIIAVVIAI